MAKSGFKMKGMHHGDGTGSHAVFKKKSALSKWDSIMSAAGSAATGGTKHPDFDSKGSFGQDVLPELAKAGKEQQDKAKEVITGLITKK